MYSIVQFIRKGQASLKKKKRLGFIQCKAEPLRDTELQEKEKQRLKHTSKALKVSKEICLERTYSYITWLKSILVLIGLVFVIIREMFNGKLCRQPCRHINLQAQLIA